MPARMASSASHKSRSFVENRLCEVGACDPLTGYRRATVAVAFLSATGRSDCTSFAGMTAGRASRRSLLSCLAHRDWLGLQGSKGFQRRRGY